MKNRKILFITPDRGEVEGLTPLLEEINYEWEHVRAGDEIGDRLDGFEPDLVLLNALVPRGNVADICRMLRKRTKAKILLITAIVSPTLMLQARHRWDVDEVVALPAPATKLMQMIGFLLGDNPVRPTFHAPGELVPRPEHAPEVKAANKIPLAGDLKDVPLGRLLAMIVRKEFHGCLTLGEGALRRRLFIAEGRLLEVTSGYLPGKALGEILARRGRLDAAQVEPLLAEATSQGLRLAELLRARKLVDAASLEQARNEQAIEKLADVFNWDGGYYEFDKAGRRESQTVESSGLLLTKAAFLAARRSADPARFSEILGKSAHEPVTLNSTAAIRPNMIDLTPEEKRFVALLKGEKIPARIVADGPLPPDAAKTLIIAFFRLRMLARPS